jgi:hypothetical protein
VHFDAKFYLVDRGLKTPAAGNLGFCLVAGFCLVWPACRNCPAPDLLHDMVPESIKLVPKCLKMYQSTKVLTAFCNLCCTRDERGHHGKAHLVLVRSAQVRGSEAHQASLPARETEFKGHDSRVSPQGQ